MPHRLQRIGEFALPGGGGVAAYDDSKSTTPDASALAIEAFSVNQGGPGSSKIRLVAGGYDKKIDLGVLAEAASRCALTYTIGSTGSLLASSIIGAGGHAINCETLARALDLAVAEAGPGEIILLSPGCASWDQFDGYTHRGDRFREGIISRFGDLSQTQQATSPG